MSFTNLDLLVNNVLIRKKKVDSFKAASSQNPYIRINWFVHSAVTTEIPMHMV